jgi:hypothetical protein
VIYYSICPLCQNVCPSSSPEVGEKFGNCNHPEYNFKYYYSCSGNSITFDILLDDIYVMAEIVGKSKNSFIRTDSGHLHLHGVIPVDWSSFDLNLFVTKINKIVEMKSFI